MIITLQRSATHEGAVGDLLNLCLEVFWSYYVVDEVKDEDVYTLANLTGSRIKYNSIISKFTFFLLFYCVFVLFFYCFKLFFVFLAKQD